jgi:hypothetical protein
VTGVLPHLWYEWMSARDTKSNVNKEDLLISLLLLLDHVFLSSNHTAACLQLQEERQ